MNNSDNNNDSNVTSIYIPRVHRKWTKPQIIQIIATQFQCIPFDLDFVTIDKMTPNDKDNNKDNRMPFQATFIPSNDSFLSAFVHINQSRHLNQAFFNKDSNFHIKIHPDPSNKEFWMIFRNSKPIPRTHLNIHQITDMNTILSNIVLDLQNQISQMQTQISQLQQLNQTNTNSNNTNTNTNSLDTPPTYFRPQSPDYPPPFYHQTNAPPPTPTPTPTKNKTNLNLADFIPL
jgi:hypothetical protein